MVDTLGLIWKRRALPASVSDPAGARLLLPGIRGLCRRLQRIWADSAYGGTLVTWVSEQYHCILQIVKPSEGQKRFEVHRKRWIVERTFAWLVTNRRLAKDYEANPRSAEAWIDVAMIGMMVRRLAPF